MPSSVSILYGTTRILAFNPAYIQCDARPQTEAAHDAGRMD